MRVVFTSLVYVISGYETLWFVACVLVLFGLLSTMLSDPHLSVLVIFACPYSLSQYFLAYECLLLSWRCNQYFVWKCTQSICLENKKRTICTWKSDGCKVSFLNSFLLFYFGENQPYNDFSVCFYMTC